MNGSSSSSSSSSSSGPGWCSWEWNGEKWVLKAQGNHCNPGYYAEPPVSPGHHVGEHRLGTCAPLG